MLFLLQLSQYERAGQPPVRAEHHLGTNPTFIFQPTFPQRCRCFPHRLCVSFFARPFAIGLPCSASPCSAFSISHEQSVTNRVFVLAVDILCVCFKASL